MSICIAPGEEGAVPEMQNDDGNFVDSIHQNISFLMQKINSIIFHFIGTGSPDGLRYF